MEKRYWKIYDAKTYLEPKNWEHEKEFRVAVSNTFGEFDVPQKQNMSFDWNLLKVLSLESEPVNMIKNRFWIS